MGLSGRSPFGEPAIFGIQDTSVLLMKEKKSIFAHILLFGGGLPLWKLRQQGYEVVASNLGEFNEGLRSSFNSPATQVNLVASKEIVENFFHGYDGMIKALLPDFRDLVKGVDLWCSHLQETVRVFGVFHGLEGDLPGRCQFGGFKKPAPGTDCECSFCKGSR